MPSLTALRSDALETNTQQMSMEGRHGPGRPVPCGFSKWRTSFSFGISPTPLPPHNTPSIYNPCKLVRYVLSLPRQGLVSGKPKTTSPGLGTLLQASTNPWQKLVWACPGEACARVITGDSFGEQILWSAPELWPFVGGWALSCLFQHLDILGSLASRAACLGAGRHPCAYEHLLLFPVGQCFLETWN